VVVSELAGIGDGAAAPSGVAAVQARIAQIQGMFGHPAAASFSSALDAASAATSADASATDGSDAGDTSSAASMASALGLDPSVVSALGGSSSTSGTAATGATGAVGGAGSSGTKAAAVIAEAKKYLGVKYVWGGESPSGFDCSGLVQYVYKKFGVNLPRVSQDQAHAGRAVSAADAKPGDLVFYHNPATHVGIYLGNGQMLDAPNSRSVVRIEKLWSGVSGFRRVLPDSAWTSAAARTAGTAGTAAAGGSTVSKLAAKLPAAGKQFASAIVSAAQHNGVDPKLLAALAWTESNFNARAVSPAGARGLVQLMPATAKGLGVDPMNPAQALEGGARYLKQQLNLFSGRSDLALAAYNAGPSAVRKYGGVPPYRETQNYVQRVQSHMAALS
jgi:cell wall-associated NlpC family hydrolase